MGDADSNMLTMEQYLVLTRRNQTPGVVKPEIRGNVNFEIKSQYMREFRQDTFSGNKNNDAYEHVEMILDILSLFNILGVTHDVVMLHVFPITLTEAAKRWVDRLSSGTINTWNLLKNPFIQRYCPPSKIAKQLEEIHNFKQKGDETLYQAWERSTSRRVRNDSSVGIADIKNKLDSLGRDIKKLKENVHAIQVGCENYGGAHLNKECPLHEEKPSLEELMNKHIKESTRKREKLEEWMKKLHDSTKLNTRNQNASLKNLEAQIEQLVKDYKARAANEVLDPLVGQCKAIFANNKASTDEASSKGTIKIQGVSFIFDDNVRVPKEIKEMHKESCHAKYHQKSDHNETMILGIPFLVTIHARIDVFDKEISLGVGDDRIVFYMNGNDLFSYESLLFLEFKKHNYLCLTKKNNEDTFVSDDMQEDREGEKDDKYGGIRNNNSKIALL
uniref:Retrotransposon gag domain-containing protein n=1 Tax=Tanacetum cinerariifolium TaxID=118510 RepID=A0A6L2JQW8_TANCI|nr:hypothetical protein [Tanacetum cinerariifolium]